MTRHSMEPESWGSGRFLGGKRSYAQAAPGSPKSIRTKSPRDPRAPSVRPRFRLTEFIEKILSIKFDLM
jgi:hypothetical protein